MGADDHNVPNGVEAERAFVTMPPPGSLWDLEEARNVCRAKNLASAENVRAQGHYTQFKIQPAKFIIENDLPFAVGNVIKYVCRFERKDGLKDLEKAKHYLDMLIAQKSGKGVDSVLG